MNKFHISSVYALKSPVVGVVNHKYSKKSRFFFNGVSAARFLHFKTFLI